MKAISLVCLACSIALTARSEVKTHLVDYRQGETALEGFSAYDDAVKGRRPGILVVHQWKGLTDYEKKRAGMLAALGYNVLAVDIYGKGIRANNAKDAAVLANQYKSDRALLRARVRAGFETLRQDPRTDPRRMAAIGYCFGGTTALELARSGADLAGVVSFHGALNTPKPEDARQIKGRILALHGADDPFVKAEEVAAFENEMRQAKVDWQLVAYGGAVHGYTLWDAGENNASGMAYNEKADRRSWAAMKEFFSEIFK